MKSLVGLVALLGFTALGVWLGIFVMLVPGIAEVIRQYQTEMVATPLAWAIVKILFAWPVIMYFIGFGVGLNKEIMK